jgi:hypothetical protein
VFFFLLSGFGSERDYTNGPTVSEILRWLTWFMASIKSIFPRASSEDLTAEKIFHNSEAALAQRLFQENLDSKVVMPNIHFICCNIS